MTTHRAIIALAVITHVRFASDAEELAMLSADFEREQQSVEAALHAPVEWRLLATLDGPGTVAVAGAMDRITAFRVEISRVDGAPENARAFVGEFRAMADGQLLKTARTTADFSLPEFPAEAASDGDAKSAWGVTLAAPHAAVFELAARMKSAGPLSFTLLPGVAPVVPFRARIFATTAEPPVCELPPDVRAILALEPSERTEAQRGEMTAFLCKLSKPLAQAQAELAKKRAALNK